MSWTGQDWGPEQLRFVTDLTGDGRADIVGFGRDGVWTAVNTGGPAFSQPHMVLTSFNSQGWRTGLHPRFVVDLTGNGKADIIGFGDHGVGTAVNNGDGTFAWDKPVLAEFGVDHGWRVEQHPRFVVDVTGDGKADIVGFGNDGVWTALSNGDGTFQAPKHVLAGFNVNQGWRVDQYPRFVVDLTGDGKADIVGFGNDGVWTAVSNGDGTFGAPKFFEGFGVKQGWRVEQHLRLLADLTGDGKADIIAFGNDDGPWVALSNGDGTFQPAKLVLEDLDSQSVLEKKGIDLSIIHISDLHCTASSHTLGQIKDGILHRDFQDSETKLDRLATYITTNRQTLGSNTVIITGDLTDSGDEEDYTDPKNGVLQFLNRLRAAGFEVFAVPGNHDYCKEGNQFLTGQFNEGEHGRRARFLRLVTPQYATSQKYPHFEDIKRSDGSLGARLILLDSMQDELDGNTDNNRAQGTLGDLQLNTLSEKLAQFQADRTLGVKVIVAMHHSPFYDSGDLGLSDAAKFKSIIAGKIDCLVYGHVTRDNRYQGPRYVSPSSYEPEDAAIAQGQVSLNIPLINVENLEYMGSTLPISVLDLTNCTRSVYYIKPYLLILHKVICDEPATSFGDDLHIYVDNNPLTPAILLNINVAIGTIADDIIQSARNYLAGQRDELKIDKGQTYNLEMEFGVSNQVALSFMEDGDAAGRATIDAKSLVGRGKQVLAFKIKEDGRYRLFYSIVPMINEYSEGQKQASLINTAFDLNGVWSDGSIRHITISRIFNALSIDMSAFNRVGAYGRLVDGQTIAVTFPDAGSFTGKLVGGDTIAWSNGSAWKRQSMTTTGIIVTSINLNGTWTDGSPHNIPIHRTDNELAIDMSSYGRPSASGRVVDGNTIVVTFPDAGSFTGKLVGDGTIAWSNGSAWNKRA